MINLTSIPQIKTLLARYGLHPKKRLGQNFLVDRNILNKLLNATEINPSKNVLEIGPGLGTVTYELAKNAANLICIEADKELIPILNEILIEFKNIQIINADILDIDLPNLFKERGNGKWTIVGNLPYYITSPIIVKLIDAKDWVDCVILMVQREVAQRLKANPGTEDYSALSVLVQFHCIVESVVKVSRNVFYPAPEVDSEIIKLVIRETPVANVKDEILFFKIVRAAFGKRRKTLQNALSSSNDLNWDKEKTRAILEKAEIDEGRRGETLSIGEFAAIENAAHLI